MAGNLSARDLVSEIWDEVAADRALRPLPTAQLADYDRLMDDTERHYINSRYVLNRAPLEDDPRFRGGAKGKLRARTARFVVAVLGRYFDSEQDFLAHLVRLQNTMADRIDRLSEEVRQLEAALQAESERLRATDITLHSRLEDRIQALEAVVASTGAPGAGDG